MVRLRAFLDWPAIIAAETVHGVLRGLLLVPLDLPPASWAADSASFDITRL